MMMNEATYAPRERHSTNRRIDLSNRIAGFEQELKNGTATDPDEIRSRMLAAKREHAELGWS